MAATTFHTALTRPTTQPTDHALDRLLFALTFDDNELRTKLARPSRCALRDRLTR